MESDTHELTDGGRLVIREAEVTDAGALHAHALEIGGESDFLTFGPGEFELTVAEEQDFLRKCRSAENQLFILGAIATEVVATLHFAGGQRLRTRHTGEMGLAVRQAHWGRGIGALMIDALIAHARAGRIITKINLRVRTDNHRAIRLYERKGFVHEGTIRREILLNGVYHDQHFMGLEL